MDILPISPVPQQEPPRQVPNTASAEQGSGFDKVLNHTLSNQNDKPAPSDTSPARSATAPGTDKNAQAHAPAESDGREIEAAITTPVPDGSETPAPVGPDLALGHFSAAATATTLTASLPIPQGSQQEELPGTGLNPASSASGGEGLQTRLPASFTQPFPQGPGVNERFGNALSIVVHGEAEVPVAAGRNSLLLAQLQQLISQNNDEVVMTASFSTPASRELPGYMGSPLVLQAADGSAELTAVTTGAAPVVAEPSLQQKAEVHPQTLRQEAQEQYFNAKLSVFEEPTDKQDARDNSSQNGSPQQQGPTPEGGTSPAIGSQPGQSPVFSSHLADTSLQAGAEASKTTPTTPSTQLPSFIREENVINQVIERFSAYSRLQTSRLSLSLHPAELGELKIDVIVKQDSLKANIVAHTQQAQEIIEKHLPRLRAILQEQGMTVEDLIVTLESDTVDDFSRHQERLFSEQDSDSWVPTNQSDPGIFDQSFEETVLGVNRESTGVNLTA